MIDSNALRSPLSGWWRPSCWRTMAVVSCLIENRVATNFMTYDDATPRRLLIAKL